MGNQQFQEPVAIVGMACRLPGGIDNPQDLWSLVSDRKSTVSEIPSSRFNKDAFLSMDQSRLGELAISHGHFLQRDLKDFDYRFFGITKEIAEAMDPQHKQLLEVVFECFESGGNTLNKVKGGNVGCFCGVFTSDYHDIEMRDPDNIPTYSAIGTTRSMLANQVSRVFDLRGPSVCIDTACSTGLVALHLAARSIQMGDCDSAVVGATNLFLGPEMALAMDRFGTLATDGQTMTFDADAHGYGRAEAVSAVYVKKLSNALRDGDDVRAVIRSTATNSDGGTTSMTVPSAFAQSEAILKAYSQVGITNMNETGYFECHGTGTPTGDPIEVSAVSKVFAPTRADDDFLWIGSTKPNIGHSEAASGLSSIIKVVQSLEKGVIPPVANFKTPNPEIKFAAGKVRVPTRLEPWPCKSTRRASINSFGIGGSNAHVILEALHGQQVGVDGTATDPASQARRPYLILLSGGSRSSMQSNASKLLEFLRGPNEDTVSLVGLTEILNLQRTQLQYMHYVIADSIQEMEKWIESSDFERTVAVPKRQPRLLFVFTGQGSIWSQMGLVLIDTFSVAHETLTKLDAIVQNLQDGTKWSLIANIRRDLSNSEIASPRFAQPLITAIQIALVDTLASWNIRPDVVVGHSSGEAAAAYAAGAITAQEAMIISYYRGTSAAEAQSGSMLAVNCAANDRRLQTKLQEYGVSISCFNSSGNLTLGASTEAIAVISKDLEELGFSCRRLPVSRAYHTASMREAAAGYAKVLDGKIHPKEADIPIYSAALGKRIRGDELDGNYWKMHLTNPVLFEEAVRSIFQLEGTIDVIVEIGPHRALSHPVNDVQKIHGAGQQRPYLSTMIRNTDPAISMLRLAGSLVLDGVDVNLRSVNGARAPNKHEMHELHRLSRTLPSYSWDYSSQAWSESRLSKEWRFRKAPRHELLGSPVLGHDPLSPTWRQILKSSQIPWLLEHQIHNSAVLPLSVFLAMVIEAVMQTEEREREVDWESNHVEVKDFVVSRSIVLEEEKDVEILLTLYALQPRLKASGRWFEFSITSVTESTATSHCRGRAGIFYGHDMGDVSDPPQNEFPLMVPIKAFYQIISKTGIRYGPSFRLLQAACSRPNSSACVATIDSHSHLSEPRSGQRYMIHPLVLDAILQTTFIAHCSGRPQDINKSLIAAEISSLKLRPLKKDLTRLHSFTQVRPHTLGRSKGVIKCYNDNGAAMLSLHGVQFVQTTSNRTASDSSLWLQQVWRPDLDAFLRSGIRPPLSLVDSRGTPQSILDFERLTRLLSQRIIARGLPNNAFPGHLAQFREWLQFQADTESIKAPGSQISVKSIASLVASPYIETSPDVKLALTLAENMQAIFDGREEPLDVMMRDGLLNEVYETGLLVGNMNDKVRFAGRLLGHKYPNMRILEIGAGTGGATVPFLDGLSSTNGQQNYKSYTFTDISSGFFENAKSKIDAGGRIEFKTLDIEREPTTQGVWGEYDLILAANVLHATSDMEKTMKHVRSMLSDGGRLLLAELSENLMASGFLMGCLPGWWLRPRDSVTANAGLSKSEWNTLLSATGFSEVSEVLDPDSDGVDNLSYTRVMMARAITASPITESPAPSENIHLVSRDGISSLRKDLRQSLLLMGGFDVHENTLCESFAPSGEKGWILVLDMDRECLLLNLQYDELTCFQRYLSQPRKVIWATKDSILNPVNPTGGLVQGFVRTLRQENDRLHIITIDFDSTNTASMAKIIRDTIQHQDVDASELELAVKEGQVHSSRIIANSRLATQFGPSRERSIPVSQLLDGEYVLSLREAGLFESFVFIQEDLAEIGDEEVLIEVKAVGLNSQDGDIAMGRQGFESFGAECAGIVRRSGKNSGFQPQDRVLAIGKGTFRTSYRTPSAYCKKIPDWLSFETAAVLPFSLVTAWYALIESGCMRSGDHVLIVHGATNVGLAAIQLALLFGAQVTTIIEHDEEQALVERLPVRPSNIIRAGSFSSNSSPRVQDRFQIILNARMHEHQQYAHALCFGGRYLQLAGSRKPEKAELASSSAANVSIMTVDIEQVYTRDGRHLGRILEQIMASIRDKELDLFSPLSVTYVADIGDSFSSLINSQGLKHVVSFDSVDQRSRVLVTQRKPTFDPQATYMIIGGLGGLGKAISVWMASCGAQNLILMTRTASQATKAKNLMDTLRAYRCHATIIVGDVAESSDVRRAICSAKYPIKGVIYGALTLKDRAFSNMKIDDFTQVFNTRVKGCYNLHHSLQEIDLEFFIMLSSACGTFGNPGQCNYAASSTFLDTFARYRQTLGLPASTIDIGFVENIGYVSRKPETEAMFSSRGLQPLSEKDILEAVEAAITTGQPRSSDIYDPFSSSQIIRGADWTESSGQMSEMVAKDARFKTPLRRADNDNHGQLAKPSGNSRSTMATTALRNEINTIWENGHPIREESLQPIVYAALVARMAEILSIDVADIQPSRSAADYGIDSLVAIQIRSWAQATISVDIPVNDLMTTYSINDLVVRIVAKIKSNCPGN